MMVQTRTAAKLSLDGSLVEKMYLCPMPKTSGRAVKRYKSVYL